MDRCMVNLVPLLARPIILGEIIAAVRHGKGAVRVGYEFDMRHALAARSANIGDEIVRSVQARYTTTNNLLRLPQVHAVRTHCLYGLRRAVFVALSAHTQQPDARI